MAAETDNEVTKFEVDGKQYEWPVFADLDIDEWLIVYEYSEVVLTDLAPKEDEQEELARVKRLNSPRLTAALAHVAFRRAYPKKTRHTIETEIGKINMVNLLGQLLPDPPAEGEEEESPTSASELEPSSRRNSDDSPVSLSPVSPTSGETPDEPLATTGTSG